MALKQFTFLIAIIVALPGIESCKSQHKKDAEAKAKIEALVPGVSVRVHNGIATLSGEMANDAEKVAAADAASDIEGITSVVNNTTVHADPAPANINPDNAMVTSAMVILKKYPNVISTVKNRIITLTGTIKKADWVKLKSTLNALHPERVENKMIMK